MAAIITLAEQANRLALDAAMAAATADGEGRVTVVVDNVCHLAVGAGVATGEIAWLVGELEYSDADGDQLAEAGVAVAAMESCMRAVSGAIQDVADRGGPIEIASSAEAMHRVCAQLEHLIPRLQTV